MSEAALITADAIECIVSERAVTVATYTNGGALVLGRSTDIAAARAWSGDLA